jgi:hypothetical protein
MKKTKKETRTTYLISNEEWLWDEEDGNYTSGPYNVREIEVFTSKEAKEFIDDFKKLFPDSKKIKIDYDRTDLEFGIISRKLIDARVHCYEEDGEKKQLEISAFKEVVELY